MIQEVIEQKLTETFNPTHIQIVNESYLHNVPPGSESHFKAVIVSNEFEGLRLVARHRKVNTVLAEELKAQVHALSIHTYTEAEWVERNEQEPASVKCKGGDK